MIIFTDVETGGLDEKKSCLLEVCLIPVDSNFTITDIFKRVISFENQGEKIIDEFCTKMHTDNELLKECTEAKSLDEVSTQLAVYLETQKDKSIILGGSSVHFDRKFLIENFPWIEAKLHYRMLDVRALNLTYDLGDKMVLPFAKDLHRAEPDCKNAIHTAKHYRKLINFAANFNPSDYKPAFERDHIDL